MIISEKEKEVFQSIVGNELNSISINKGFFSKEENSLRASKIALLVSDSERSNYMHYLMIQGDEIDIEYLGDCGRIKVQYFLSKPKPLKERSVFIDQHLDSEYSFNFGLESSLIKTVRFYGHIFKGTIQEVNPGISKEELRGEHSLKSLINNYSLNIIELVHEGFSTIIRTEERGLEVFLERKIKNDLMIDMKGKRYNLLMEV